MRPTPLLKGLLIAVSAGLAMPAGSQQAIDPPSQVRLPSLGDGVSDDFNLTTERRIGDQIMREVKRDPAYVDDPLLLDYVQSIWSPLVASARQRGEIGTDTEAVMAWETFLVRDRSVNAFALPGGFVGVHLGLMAITATPDELASVLAHELSHVTQRHIARSVATSSRAGLLSVAGMLLGILAAARTNNADMATAAVVTGNAAAAQGQLNFTRDMEREADRVGYGVLTGAGFAPSGVAAIFEKLEQANRLNDSGAFPYLRSHPLTTERIGEARARAQAAGGRAQQPPSLEHMLMQARARVLMDTSVAALRREQQLDQRAGEVSGPEAVAALYASAIASTMLRDNERAAAALQKAHTAARSSSKRDTRADRMLALLDAESLRASGKPREAVAQLDRIDDGSRVLMIARGEAALDLSRAGGGDADVKRSGEALLSWVTVNRQDALAWQLLARCAEQAGQPLKAIRADAEARAALGDLSGAIDRLRAGQRLARSGGSPDFIESSVIDARVRQLDKQRRQIYFDLYGREMPPS